MFPRSATGRSSLVPPPPWHYSGQMLTIEFRTDPAAVAELLPAAARAGRRGSGRRRRDLGRLAELQRHVRGAARPGAGAVPGDVRRRALPVPRRDVQPVRVHLGRQGLRHGPRPPPGLPEEARRAVRDPAGQRRRRRAAARAGRALRRDVLGLRPAADRRHVHDHRHGADRPGSSTATRCSTTACSRPSRATAPTRCTSWSRCAATTPRSGPCYAGDATIELHESPVEELTRLAPIEMIGGYWQEVGTNWRAGTTLERSRANAERRAAGSP